MTEPRHAASPARRGAPGLPPVRTPIVAMVAFAVLATLAATVRVDWAVVDRFDPLGAARSYTPTPIPQATQGEPVQPEITPLPWAAPVFWTVLALIGLVLAIVLARWLWRIRPRRRVQVVEPGPTDPTGIVLVEEQAAALRQGALSALDLLDEIPDPQDAVIRSWLALEQAALATGAPRQVADSPSEFAGALLAATGADPDAVNRLLHLYHRARFSTHPVGLAEVREARSCVLGLSHSLAGYEQALRTSVGSLRRRPST